MKRIFLVVLNIIIIISIKDSFFSKSEAIAPQSSKEEVENEKLKLLNLEELNWNELANGLKISLLWGKIENPDNYGLLVKIPSGKDFKITSHSYWLRKALPYHGLILKGNIITKTEGEKTKTLNSSGYFNKPSKINYIDRCDSKSDCIIFITNSGILDLNSSFK